MKVLLSIIMMVLLVSCNVKKGKIADNDKTDYYDDTEYYNEFMSRFHKEEEQSIKLPYYNYDASQNIQVPEEIAFFSLGLKYNYLRCNLVDNSIYFFYGNADYSPAFIIYDGFGGMLLYSGNGEYIYLDRFPKNERIVFQQYNGKEESIGISPLEATYYNAYGIEYKMENDKISYWAQSRNNIPITKLLDITHYDNGINIKVSDIIDEEMLFYYYNISNNEIFEMYLSYYLSACDWIISSLIDEEFDNIMKEYSLDKFLENRTDRELAMFRNIILYKNNYNFENQEWQKLYEKYSITDYKSHIWNYRQYDTNEEIMGNLTENERKLLDKITYYEKD
jgi:hypothetical protein